MHGIEEDDGNPAHWLPLNKDGVREVLTEARQGIGDVFSVETDPSKMERGGTQLRAYANDILGYYHKRSLITGTQLRAGYKLHQIWYHGWASRYTTSRFGSQPGSGADFESVRLLALEYVDVMSRIRGRETAMLVRAVCCYGERAGRGMMMRLGDGLDDIAKYYGYDRDE